MAFNVSICKAKDIALKTSCGLLTRWNKMESKLFSIYSIAVRYGLRLKCHIFSRTLSKSETRFQRGKLR